MRTHGDTESRDEALCKQIIFLFFVKSFYVRSLGLRSFGIKDNTNSIAVSRYSEQKLAARTGKTVQDNFSVFRFTVSCVHPSRFKIVQSLENAVFSRDFRAFVPSRCDLQEIRNRKRIGEESYFKIYGPFFSKRSRAYMLYPVKNVQTRENSPVRRKCSI